MQVENYCLLIIIIIFFSAYFPYRIEVRQEKNLTPFSFALFLQDVESFFFGHLYINISDVLWQLTISYKTEKNAWYLVKTVGYFFSMLIIWFCSQKHLEIYKINWIVSCYIVKKKEVNSVEKVKSDKKGLFYNEEKLYVFDAMKSTWNC